MSDSFASFGKSLTGPATRHWLLTASASDLNPMPRAIYCQEAGQISLRDEAGNVLSYDMTAGALLPIRATRVVSIDSGTFYGWL